MFDEYQKMMSEVMKRACFSDCDADMVVVMVVKGVMGCCWILD